MTSTTKAIVTKILVDKVTKRSEFAFVQSNMAGRDKRLTSLILHRSKWSNPRWRAVTYANHKKGKGIKYQDRMTTLVEFVLETTYPSETDNRLDINKMLRQIMPDQNSSVLDSSVRRSDRRITRIRRIIRPSNVY